MTEAKSNIWGRYSEDDIRIIREENRILEMRWEVFEGLYDKERQETVRLKVVQEENIRLSGLILDQQTRINSLDNTIVEYRGAIDRLQEGLNERSVENAKLLKLCDEAIIENEKLQEQIALYINPLKDLEDVVTQTDL